MITALLSFLLLLFKTPCDVRFLLKLYPEALPHHLQIQSRPN